MKLLFYHKFGGNSTEEMDNKKTNRFRIEKNPIISNAYFNLQRPIKIHNIRHASYSMHCNEI